MGDFAHQYDPGAWASLTAPALYVLKMMLCSLCFLLALPLLLGVWTLTVLQSCF